MGIEEMTVSYFDINDEKCWKYLSTKCTILWYTMSGKATKAQKLNNIVQVKKTIVKIYIKQAGKN